MMLGGLVMSTSC